VIDYTHRDRRAQRAVGRVFFGLAGATVALIGFALGVPVRFAGLVSVVALGALGMGYIGWADRFLEEYATDLRTGADGSGTDGFLRVELNTPVGLDREIGRPTARSPHARRRAPGSSAPSDETGPEMIPNSGQL
jgi:hypothetical protein